VVVPAGYVVTVYSEDKHTGLSAALTSDTRDLYYVPGPTTAGFNDATTSIFVVKL
jgi:hypothetical protein